MSVIILSQRTATVNPRPGFSLPNGRISVFVQPLMRRLVGRAFLPDLVRQECLTYSRSDCDVRRTQMCLSSYRKKVTTQVASVSRPFLADSPTPRGQTGMPDLLFAANSACTV